MYSSFSQSKHRTYIPIFAIQLLFTRSVLSLNLTNAYLHHKCLDSEGKYQPKSDYEDHFTNYTNYVNHDSLTEGFFHMTSGNISNFFTGLLQCRGDSYKTHCRNCFTTAVAGLTRRCQRNKGAIIWYDQCFFFISSVLSGYDYAKLDDKNTFSMHNKNNMNGDINLFNKKTKDLLNKLILIANNNGTNSKRYAVGQERVGTKNIYAMVQCPFLSDVCEKCLKLSIKELPKCCNGKQGARVFVGTSCNIRYELYPFIRM